MKKYLTEIKENYFDLLDKKSNVIITSIGDIHISDSFDIQKFEIIKTMINKNSDYVCFVGDNLDSTNFIRNGNGKMIKNYLNFLEDISKEYKIFLNRSGIHDLSYRIRNSWEKDAAIDFWKQIESISNLKVSNVEPYYTDEKISLFNLEIPFELYNNKFYLGEDKNMLIEIIEKNKNLYLEDTKIKILMIHSPRLIVDEDILNYVKKFDIILCGHMHNGMMLPILDHLFKNSNKGIISPDRKLFPDNTRGIKEIEIDGKKIYLVITGGITKLGETTGFLSKFNSLYPMSVNHIYVKTLKK